MIWGLTEYHQDTATKPPPQGGVSAKAHVITKRDPAVRRLAIRASGEKNPETRKTLEAAVKRDDQRKAAKK
jgi:hypothetical protein